MTTIMRERRPNGVEILRLDRPEVRNAINSAMLAELERALTELAVDPKLRVLIFSSTDVGALSAGADVAEQLETAAATARIEAITRIYAAVVAFPVPTIAVCVGNVVGAGAELACACDLRVGGENLKLMFPGARFGIPVGPARLTPLIGMSKAKELIMTSRVVEVEEAERLGLLAARAAPSRAEECALQLADSLVAQSPSGLRAIKQLFDDYERSSERTAHENDRIVAFQRAGVGIPPGGVKR